MSYFRVVDNKDPYIQEMKLLLKSLKIKIEIGTDEVNVYAFLFLEIRSYKPLILAGGR